MIKVSNFNEDGFQISKIHKNPIFDLVFENNAMKLREYFKETDQTRQITKLVNERDIHKRSPIFYAVYFKNYELISILLEYGADTLFSDEKGRTILHYASILGVKKSIISLILDYHNMLQKSEGHTR